MTVTKLSSRSLGVDCAACVQVRSFVRMGRAVAGADVLHGARAARLLGYFLVSFGTLGMQYAFGPIYAELLKQLRGSREVVTVHTHGSTLTRSTYTHAHTHSRSRARTHTHR